MPFELQVSAFHRFLRSSRSGSFRPIADISFLRGIDVIYPLAERRGSSVFRIGTRLRAVFVQTQKSRTYIHLQL